MKTTKTTKPKKDPKGTKVLQAFMFKLNMREFAEKGKTAAGLSKEIAGIEAEFEEVKDTFKARIKDREAKRDDLLAVINAGEEKREVESTMVMDYDAGKVRYFFEGEMIEERKMTDDERQLQMPLKTGADGKTTTTEKSSKRQKLSEVKHSDLAGKDDEIKSVIRQETNKVTKLSAVDGARA